MDRSKEGLTDEDRRLIKEALKAFEVDEDAEVPASILLAALVVGANADTVAKALGLNRDNVVRPIAKRLRDNGVWKNGVTYCGWFDDDEKVGAASFLCDTLVAMGRANRGEGFEKLIQDGTAHTRQGQEAP